MTENVLSLRKLCTELLGVADEPGLSSTSTAIECRKVLYPPNPDQLHVHPVGGELEEAHTS